MDFGPRQRELLKGLKHNYPEHPIHDEQVLEAIGKVPRHAFVPAHMRDAAYQDSALPLRCGQTISQPFIVAAMSQALELQPGARVLEIGTGSGYQAAVLAEMGAEVFSIEYHQQLAKESTDLLRALGYQKVHIRAGDGSRGWPEEAPFDGIVVTCCAPKVLTTWTDQLAEGAKLVVPVETAGDQELISVKRAGGELHKERLFPVRFVPLLGEG